MVCEAIVSDRDKERLIERIKEARSSWITYAPCLDWLWSGLNDSRAVPPVEVPHDMITMNSVFEVTDLKAGEPSTYTLVYPEDEALDEGRLCALSPMGMALLGARVGEVVHWRGAQGVGAVKVTDLIYQPEAAGDHDL